MKQLRTKIAILILFLAVAVAGCRKGPQPLPEEQELITTVKLSITDSISFSQTFIYKIENGFGSVTAGTVQIDTIKLAANKTFYATVEIFNDKVSPAEDITEEVLEERDDHLFLYLSNPMTGAGAVSVTNGSRDNNNLPFNQVVALTTGGAGTGKFQVNLMHDPVDKNGTTPGASGGETDVEAVFPVVLQ